MYTEYTYTHIYICIYIHILLYNSYPLYIGFSQQYFGHSPKKKGWCSWDLPSDSDQMQGLNQQHQQPKGAWLYLHRQHWFKGKNTGKLCEGFKKKHGKSCRFCLKPYNPMKQMKPTISNHVLGIKTVEQDAKQRHRGETWAAPTAPGCWVKAEWARKMWTERRGDFSAQRRWDKDRMKDGMKCGSFLSLWNCYASIVRQQDVENPSCFGTARTIPYAPCMEYLPTFAPYMTQM